MEFLGIGPVELLFVVIILLLVMGPTDLVEFASKLGTNIRKMRQSPTWNTIVKTARTLRNLPNTIADETGVNDLKKDLLRGTEFSNSIGNPGRQEKWGQTGPQGGDSFAAWTTPPDSSDPPPPPLDAPPPVGEPSPGEPAPAPPEEK